MEWQHIPVADLAYRLPVIPERLGEFAYYRYHEPDGNLPKGHWAVQRHAEADEMFRACLKAQVARQYS